MTAITQLKPLYTCDECGHPHLIDELTQSVIEEPENKNHPDHVTLHVELTCKECGYYGFKKTTVEEIRAQLKDPLPPPVNLAVSPTFLLEEKRVWGCYDCRAMFSCPVYTLKPSDDCKGPGEYTPDQCPHCGSKNIGAPFWRQGIK